MVQRMFLRALELLVMCVLLYPFGVSAKHGQAPLWVNESRDLKGYSCCGVLDCVPLEYAQILDRHGEFTGVNVNGNRGDVSWESAVPVQCPNEDPRPYVCFRVGHENLANFHNGSSRIIVSPEEIKCLLVPQCQGGNS